MKKCTLSLVMLILSMQVGFAESLDVLVFSKTAAFRHPDAINAGNSMFTNIANINGWNVDFSENSADFTIDNLSRYNAIIWNNVSGDVLNASEEQAFQLFINGGGGYVGIHNAADAETDWSWYVDLLGGATFLNHAGGNDQIQSATINVEDASDPIASHFQSPFNRTDEWYNFASNPRSFVDVLLSIDESTLSGPNMGGDHPIAWKHEYDGGRVFYTGFGHTASSFSEPGVVTMLTEAVKWAASDNNSFAVDEFRENRVILDEFNGSEEPGQWTVQAPYNGIFPYTASANQLELPGIEPGPNQHLVREGLTIDPSSPYTIETKFKILNSGGIKSFAINFLQDNQSSSENINTWSLNLDLNGPVIKYMGFVNGKFNEIGSRSAPWAVQNQEYIYKIEVNRRINGDISQKWVTATISKPDGTVMDNFEVNYSNFPWQPNLNGPAKFGLNSHFASWVASDLKVLYSEEPLQQVSQQLSQEAPQPLPQEVVQEAIKEEPQPLPQEVVQEEPQPPQVVVQEEAIQEEPQSLPQLVVEEEIQEAPPQAPITQAAFQAVPQQISQEPIRTPHLLGYWPFDGDAEDVSGNQNHGTEFNDPNYPKAYINSGLEGYGAYAIADSAPFDLSAFTIMAWIKPNDVSDTWRVIVEKDRRKSDWFGLYQKGNKIHLRWGPTPTPTHRTTAQFKIKPNVFTHVTGTFDGSTAMIYINGALKHIVSGSPSTPTTDGGDFRIGIDGIGVEAFQGIIDELKVFRGALNYSQIELEMDSSPQISAIK